MAKVPRNKAKAARVRKVASANRPADRATNRNVTGRATPVTVMVTATGRVLPSKVKGNSPAGVSRAMAVAKGIHKMGSKAASKTEAKETKASRIAVVINQTTDKTAASNKTRRNLAVVNSRNQMAVNRARGIRVNRAREIRVTKGSHRVVGTIKARANRIATVKASKAVKNRVDRAVNKGTNLPARVQDPRIANP